MYDFLIKAILLGESSVGKSSILNRLLYNEYKVENIPTIGVEFGTTLINVNSSSTDEPSNATFKLQLWDSAGQDKFRSIITSYFRGVILAILVYDVSNGTSFSKIEKWYDEYNKNKITEDAVIVLVGNKSDSMRRVISYDEGEELADRLRIPIFLEISAKTGYGVKDLFEQSIKYLYDRILSAKPRTINGVTYSESMNRIVLSQFKTSSSRRKCC